ncbi:jmjC domain-containing protein 8 isoform X1 [Prionailurus bengalensis]|uniref:jmjC domain-containing protein 8 isoform X1 n=1 Tax=Prionailurus bengalensis TaxID=37029 RepID=UPI001CA9B57B|nr:jmjC domain-containing protein 8 isoform X1 [Prionailurus bengalensis]XP_043417049.1 jmjC domain-containing protein 8 isoform X1 [Prionailurus bengalensis]
MPRGGGLMASGARLQLLLALWTLAGPARPVAADAGDGGWQRRGPGAAAAAVAEEERCAVERRADLSYSEFVQHYAFSRPVILQRLTDNSRFRALCSREKLLASFGDSVVRLSTANTYSYRKVDLPFQEYVEHLLHPQDPASLGNDTLYFFGDNNFSEWASLFQHYSPPPFSLLGTTAAYSFGVAATAGNSTGAGSGVPFHWHGPGFSEVVYGRKRWFLYPPEKTPEFHPNKTTLAWLQDVYPALAPSERPLECTVQAGEVLYFPDRWWHATLNLDTSVFISTFLS